MTTDVQKFFGGAIPSNAVIRPRLAATDVSQDEAGLRQLAATGSWLAVLQLAERLEQRCLSEFGPKAPPTDQSLRFALVRVTAYLKMNQPDAAKRALDLLGDVLEIPAGATGSPSIAGKKGSLTVPFSLLFLSAVVPGFVGQIATSQAKLYELLSHCEANQARSVVDRLLWKSRAKRVKRALVANHLEQNEYTLAISTLTDLAESETDEIRHYWYQQQLGCLCLRTGNVFLALEVFKAIENTAVDDDDEGEGDEGKDRRSRYDAHEFKRLVCAVNKGLLLVFRGEYAEAQTLFRAIGTSAADSDSLPPLASLLRTCSVASAEGCCAAYITTAPKVDDAAAAAAASPSVQQVISQLEAAIQRSPKTLLSMDAALMSLSRLYMLEGEHGQAKIATLGNVVELFRCGREGLPRFLK